MSKIFAAITGLSGWVPDYKLTNKELETIVDTNDDWIQSRTGIKERRILRDKKQGTSDMSVHAVKDILKKKKIDPNEIDLLICATTTPDMVFPATANIICDKAGINNAFSYDINAACSGFLYALFTGSKFIESGTYKKIIIVGADKMSTIVDYTDRSTCILFGDGAGAVLLEPNEEYGIIDGVLQSDGSGRDFLHMKAGGSLKPPSYKTIERREHFVFQEGQSVYKFAITHMADATLKVMERNSLKSDDITWLVPHQANKRIIDAIAKRMKLSSEKVMLNIEKYGNTTNGTIPLCLWEWENKLKKGDNLILATVGGGFTWGAIYVKWAYDS